MAARPGAVVVVAAFLFAAAGVSAVVAIALLFPGTALDRMWDLNPRAAEAFHAWQKTAGALLLALGAATAAAAAGLLRGKRWAWQFAVALFAINGIGNAVALAATGDFVRSGAGIAAGAVFLLLLWRKRTRSYLIVGRG